MLILILVSGKAMEGAGNRSAVAFKSSGFSFATTEHDTTSVSANMLICKMRIILTTLYSCHEK